MISYCMLHPQLLHTFEASASVSALRLSPDGRLLAAAHTDGTLTVFSLAALQQPTGCEGDLTAKAPAAHVRMTNGHTKGLSDCCWTPDGSVIATASDDNTIALWDAATGALLARFVGHASFVFCLSVSPCGSLLASGSYDESVRLWDLRGAIAVGRNAAAESVPELPALRIVAAHADPVTGVCFAPDGSVLASSSYDGTLRLWDVHDRRGVRPLRTLVASGDTRALASSAALPPAASVAFTPNGRYILAACLDGALRLHGSVPRAGDASGCAALRTYRGVANARYCMPPAVARLPGEDLQIVLACSEDGNVHVFDLRTAASLGVLQCPLASAGDTAEASFVCVASDSSSLVYASRGSRLFVHSLI